MKEEIIRALTGVLNECNIQAEYILKARRRSIISYSLLICLSLVCIIMCGSVAIFSPINVYTWVNGGLVIFHIWLIRVNTKNVKTSYRDWSERYKEWLMLRQMAFDKKVEMEQI
jgi:hypothetical protein